MPRLDIGEFRHRAQRSGCDSLGIRHWVDLSSFISADLRTVPFWGCDSAMESSFFVTDDAQKRIQPDMRFDHAAVLQAFDVNRQVDLRDRGEGLCAWS